MGIGEVLFAIFVTLKLLDVIDWSWWLVTAPLWIPAVTLCVILLLAAIGVSSAVSLCNQ